VGALLEPLTEDDPTSVGRFLIRARLGAGGMGRVYLASTEGGRPVAVKVMRSEIGLDPEFRERFRQEVEAARRVHGFYTAQVLDADPDAPQPWLATVYVPAPSLHQVVREHGVLPEASVLLLMAGIGEALQAIHAAGIVHRDLKPSNVLLAADGPRVIDFGIARMAEATSVTRFGMVVGSPGYMAPEQVLDGTMGPAIDVFALGSLAAFAAQGYGPFGDGSSITVLHRVANQAAVLDGCPPRVLAIVERCLEKDPARRPTPSGIIDYCRQNTVSQSPELSHSWLPEPVAAAVTQEASALLPPPSQAQASLPYLPPLSRPSSPSPRPSAPAPGPTSAPTPGPWAQPPVTTGPAAGYVTMTPETPRRTSRKSLVGIAIGALVLAAIAGGIVYSIASGARNNTTDKAGSAGESSTTSPSGSTTPSVADTGSSTPTTAAAPWYSGTWTGTASQPSGIVTEWTVELTLPADGGAGTFTSPSLGCSGSLAVTSTAQGSVSLKEDLISDPQQVCVDGNITLDDAGSGQADFTWQDATQAQNVATAQLSQE
jgi:serine/threonine protein kinase